MDAPTAQEVKARSSVLAASYPTADDEKALDALLEVTAPLVGSLTGRIIAGTEGEEVPDALIPIAVTAIAMKTAAMFPNGASVEAAEEAATNSRLRSISAGSWSESYFGPGEAAQAKQLDLDPTLASLLWALATEEKKAEWLELWEGKEKGFSVVEAFDYGQRPGGY